MPNVTITNIQSIQDYLPSLYKQFDAGESITVFREQSELDGMADLKDRVYASQFTATTAYTAQELLSSVAKLACAPGSVVAPGQKVQRAETAPIPIAAPGPVAFPVVFPEAFKAATEPDVAIAVDYTAAGPGASLGDVGTSAITNAGFTINFNVLIAGVTVVVEWVAVGEAA